MVKEQEKTGYRIGYVLILLCISIPLLAEYVMENPSILHQLELVEKLTENPSLCGKQVWFLIPMVLRNLGFTITTSYRISMFLAHLFSFGAVIWFGNCIFQEKKQIFFLTALYLLNPVYLSFSYAEMYPAGLFLWAVIPLVCGTMADLLGRIRGDRNEVEKRKNRKWKVVIYAVSLLTFICVVLYVTGNAQVDAPQQIKGYAIGQMLHTFVWEDGYPGLGIGVLAAVVLLMWQLTARKRELEKKYWIYGVSAQLFIMLSSAFFMWQIPALLLGCAMLPLSVLGTLGVTGFDENDGGFLHWGIPLILLITLAGVAVYICNDMMYTHMPLFLQDILPQ